MLPLLILGAVGLAVASRRARRPKAAGEPPLNRRYAPAGAVTRSSSRAPQVERTRLRLVPPPDRRRGLFEDLSRVALADAAVAADGERAHLRSVARAWAERAASEPRERTGTPTGRVGTPTDRVGSLELPETVTVETGKKERVDNLPNAATLLGYGLGVWWCVGGPAWSALASIVLDEVDGRLARATGETTSFGADLDFTSDVVLSGMALQRMGAPAWTIPASTLGSLAFRKRYGRPPVGSLRAAIMLAGVLKGKRR